MSLQTKVAAVKELVGLYTKWPTTAKVYNSFRDERLSYYNQQQPSKIPAVETLRLRTGAVKAITSDENALRFPVSEALKHPDGNSSYYKSIMREAMMKNEKTSKWAAIKATTFGWWK